MNRLLFSLILLTSIYSCGDKVDPSAQNTADTTNADTDTSAYLPVLGFLRDDMRQVDSFSTGIVRKVTNGNKQDSSFIKLAQFHQLADQFLLKELDSASFAKSFEETSLMDETSRMLNFIYTPKDANNTLRQVMVYVAPSLSNDNIDRVYMETSANQGDTVVEKKMTWKMRKYLYVLTVKHIAGTSTSSIEKLIWDPQHFADK